MSVEVELCGGHVDGQRVALDADPQCPPRVIEIAEPSSINWSAQAEDVDPIRKIAYHRERTQAPGHVWRYHRVPR